MTGRKGFAGDSVFYRKISFPLMKLQFIDFSHSWIRGTVLEQTIRDWDRLPEMREMWVTGAFWESDDMMRSVEEKSIGMSVTVEL